MRYYPLGVSVIARFIPLLLTLGVIHGQEVTVHHIMQAICQVETGCVWIAPGKVKGKWTTGSYREVSPWQLAPAVITDLRASVRRVRSDCQYAEDCVLRWLCVLQQRGLDLRQVAAAYHRGYTGRTKPEAKEYAERVVSLAERLAREGK